MFVIPQLVNYTKDLGFAIFVSIFLHLLVEEPLSSIRKAFGSSGHPM